MTKPHYNCKPMIFELNDTIIEFPSRKALLGYMEEVHGLGNTTVRLIINSGKPYSPRQHALKYLTGLRIYHV